MEKYLWRKNQRTLGKDSDRVECATSEILSLDSVSLAFLMFTKLVCGLGLGWVGLIIVGSCFVQ